MKVLILGRGGREHAIAWKISQSKNVDKIYVATGNAGMEEFAEIVNIKAEEVDKLLEFALDKKIDLTLVGPEVSFMRGIVDKFNEHNLKIMGPTRKVAQLEASKAFAKELMDKYNIPTAKYGAFDNEEEAFEYIETVGAPLVVRADGLAAGKGLIVAKDEITAKLAVNVMMKDKIFGEAGSKVVIEEFLVGRSITVFAFIQNNKVIGYTTAEDYKRAYDGDRGPNTGGMGAFSPSNKVDEKLIARIEKEILNSVLNAMKKEGLDYSGIMFINFILTNDGPKVVEFNLRFNDPLTQVILPRLENDLFEVIMHILNGEGDTIEIKWKDKICLGVVAVSQGYPLKYKTDFVISGIDEVNVGDDILLFHARTKKVGNNYLTCGGRIVDIISLGNSIEEVRKKVYGEMKKIDYYGIHYRHDIGIA